MLSIRRFLLHRICVQHLIKPDFLFLKKAIFYTSLLCFRVQTREVKVQIWPSQYYNMRLYLVQDMCLIETICRKRRKDDYYFRRLFLHTPMASSRLAASKCCVKMLLACALKHVAYLAIQKKEIVVRHDLFCKYAKIIPYLPGLFVIVFLKVSSYYEQ